MNQHKSSGPAAVIFDDWLAVSTEGFASMNAARPPEHLIKELVQNALDAVGEKSGQIVLTVQPSDSGDGIIVTCRDSGCGLANPADIRTVFWTSKTDSHLQRGRMGRGFKEMLCLANWATVISNRQKIEFTIAGGKRITRQAPLPADQATPGTEVTMAMPWPSEVVPVIEGYFQTLLPPENVELVVNSHIVRPRTPVHRIESTLPTELFEDGRWCRPSRKTVIELIAINPEENPSVYEMGIPICPVAWDPPLHINVQQRVPMNPCRDALASGYLVKLHQACLPVLLPQMLAAQVLTDWVGAAVPHCPADIQQEVIRRGFGEHLACSVPKMGSRQFDEDARDLGTSVIDAKQTSGGFRQILQQHVPTTRQVVEQHHQELVTAATSSSFDVADAFGSQEKHAAQRRKLIDAVGGKDRVEQVLEFARWFCQKLIDSYGDNSICSVKLALLKPVQAMATWDSNDELTLGIDTPELWLDPLGPDSLATYIHECSHHQAMNHGRDFHKEVEKLAGRAAAVMLHHGQEVRQRWDRLYDGI